MIESREPQFDNSVTFNKKIKPGIGTEEQFYRLFRM